MTQTVQQQIDEARAKLIQDLTSDAERLEKALEELTASLEEANRFIAQAEIKIEELESQLKEPQDDRADR